ncbi:hypothetical protein BC941DRAFT_445151 [Chlamydoabsidia padenii]|nr:hypothetical protein BC941DRAFT_445151 [Chlamydoabsidia padenii]
MGQGSFRNMMPEQKEEEKRGEYMDHSSKMYHNSKLVVKTTPFRLEEKNKTPSTFPFYRGMLWDMPS